MNQNELSFKIERGVAAPTYSKWSSGPVELKKGDHKTRIHISTKPDTMTDVYLETIPHDFFGSVKSSVLSQMDKKFIKSKLDNKTIYINVNSLSHRLGIDPEVIYKKVTSTEDFTEIIDGFYDEYLKNEKIVNEQFEKIISDKYQLEDGEIKTKDEWKHTISKDELFNMIGIAQARCVNSETTEKEMGFQLKNGKVLHLKTEKNSEWPQINLFSEEILGKGDSATARNVVELSKGRLTVAKKERRVGGDTKDEVKILNSIHMTNPALAGIQKKPHAVFDFKVRNKYFNSSFRGYFGEKYQASLDKMLLSLSDETKIECARQLLKGLVELEKQKICHGDIKLNNCFFIQHNDDSFECVLADLAGSCYTENCNMPDYGADEYQSEMDDAKFRYWKHEFKSSNPEKKQRAAEEIEKVLFRRDILAMSCVLKELLTKAQLDQMNDLYNRMLRKNYSDRIGATAALQEFERIFPLKEKS